MMPRDLILALAALSVGLAAAAPQAMLRAQAPAKATPAKARRFIDLYGDVGQSRETARGTLSTLSGNVRIVSEDAVLRTGAATYEHKTQVATAPGRLQIEDAQNTLQGNSGVAYYKTRTAEVRGDVRIIVRPRPGDAKAPEGSLRREFKEPVVITCDRVDYNWRTRVAVATGNLTFRQKERRVTAERAVYEGRRERVTLTGDVRGVMQDGGEAQGEKAIAILTEGAESLTLQNVKKVRIPVEDDQDDDAAGDAEEASPEAPTPGAPDVLSPAAPPPSTPAAQPTAAPRP